MNEHHFKNSEKKIELNQGGDSTLPCLYRYYNLYKDQKKK